MARYKTWMHRVPALIAALEALDHGAVTAAWLATYLEVTPRRVGQVFGHLVCEKAGTASIFDRQTLIRFLKKKPIEETPEEGRRRRVAQILNEARQTPRVLIEAPAKIVNTELAELPGVYLEPGTITVTGFKTVQEALEKLLKLAYAIGNDYQQFAERIQPAPAPVWEDGELLPGEQIKPFDEIEDYIDNPAPWRNAAAGGKS
jgi:hypothetical protein